MTKTYKLITEDEKKEDDQKTVEVSWSETQDKQEKKTPAQLKEDITEKKNRIKKLREEINEHIDELNAINDNTELSIKEIPSKISLEEKAPEKIQLK